MSDGMRAVEPITLMEPTPEEIARFKAGPEVVLLILGRDHPPFMIRVGKSHPPPDMESDGSSLKNSTEGMVE